MMKDYLEFFGLTDDPFKITPDSYYFFLSEAHQEALSSLRYLLETEEGFAVIVGEPGTGKTLTVRKFVDELSEDVKYAYILFPNLTPEELFEAILEDLGIESEGRTKNRLFAKLRDYLIENRRAGKKVLVIIDEAQNLPTETLEELRILSNLETKDEKLLQIILLGQPELEEKLESAKLRQLKQRITIMVKLRNFTEEETRAYIDHRIAKAGKGNLKINPKVYGLVYRYSLGIPRLINIIMERALMAAYVETSREVKPAHVKRAVESIGIRIDGGSFPKRVVMTLSGIFLVATILLSAVYFVPEHIDRKAPETGGKVTERKDTTLRERPVSVSVPMLNMREFPDLSADVIYVLEEGDTLEIIERGPGTWLKVRFRRGDLEIEGWVNGKYVRENRP